MIPIAVTIAGSDSGGGAGIQADLKTFSALGIYGASVIAALTAQNTKGVAGIHDVPPEFVTAQLDAVYSDLKVRATKIGMLSRPATIEAVAAGLKKYSTRNVVLDPVMIAASGDRLLVPEAADTIKRLLFPLADIITPNLAEAAALLGQPVAKHENEMAAQGEALLKLGAKAVLVKGGHAPTKHAVDVLIEPSGVRRFTVERIDTPHTHGTGCTLSSAIAAGLAKGLELHDALAAAKNYITGALKAGVNLGVGTGRGPVHHFHALWTKLGIPAKSEK
ncbi:MAG: bifunctional hydroxymethylpyrimidine kinase/phosphomethylpyrimidine kinase [Xanthobacteraceae bacterium]|nr:bifunctional hydroxymethylpyrimidine kinase/phosphomethylpyrimidine kinase [Xanthobacteraceae bacterium]